jgi:transposase
MWFEDRFMAEAEEARSGRRVRRWRSVSEKRQIVQLTLEPGASVAEVARAHGVNANQVFKWRRAFERGELFEPCALLPVSVATPSELASETPDRSAEEPATSSGTIHIELPGGAMIWVERGSDPALLHSILESLCQ